MVKMVLRLGLLAFLVCGVAVGTMGLAFWINPHETWMGL